MTALQIVGRVLFALVFVVSPAGVLRQVRTVAGAVLILLGLWPDLGALMVVAFLVPVTLTMHRFWELDEPGPRAIKRGAFLLNLSLAGGGILYFCLVHQTQDVPGGLLSDPLLAR